MNESVFLLSFYLIFFGLSWLLRSWLIRTKLAVVLVAIPLYLVGTYFFMELVLQIRYAMRAAHIRLDFGHAETLILELDAVIGMTTLVFISSVFYSPARRAKVLSMTGLESVYKEKL